MTASIEATIHERVQGIEATPSIPAVFLPLLKLLNEPPDRVRLDDVVKLVSYDNTIAAQCLRVASSPLFGLSKPPESIRAAVISLGLRRVQTELPPHVLSGTSLPYEELGSRSHGILAAFARLRNGLPEIQPEDIARGRRQSLHGRADARYRIHG